MQVKRGKKFRKIEVSQIVAHGKCKMMGLKKWPNSFQEFQ